MLAAFDLLLWANGVSTDRPAVYAVGGWPVPAYVPVAWGLTAAGHGIAWLTRRRLALDDRAEYARAVDGLAAVTAVAASLLGLVPLGGTAAVLAYAAALVAASPAVPVGVAAAVAVFVAVKWMAADTLLNRPPGGTTAAVAGLGIGIVAVLVGVGWAVRRRTAGRRALRAFSVIVGVWATSAAVDAAFAAADGRRFSHPGLAEQVALSVLWAVSAAVVVVAGFGRQLPDLRYVGLGLFALTLLKVVGVDLAGVGAGYRILSFLGLGGLLLATSVLYGRLGGASPPPQA